MGLQVRGIAAVSRGKHWNASLATRFGPPVVDIPFGVHEHLALRTGLWGLVWMGFKGSGLSRHGGLGYKDQYATLSRDTSFSRQQHVAQNLKPWQIWEEWVTSILGCATTFLRGSPLEKRSDTKPK